MAIKEVQELDNSEQLDFDDSRELTEKEKEDQAEMLDKLGLSLAKYRTDAIGYRTNSGIENEWMEDREHYEGVDDTNRGELGSWESKPLGQGALQEKQDTGSTVFFNITRPYCDSASARVGDMLLPTDDKGWAINPTPIPDMIAVAGGNVPYKIEQQIRSQVPEEQVQSMVAEIIANEKMIVEEAKAVAKRAEKRIEDWHIESQFNAEMRKVIEDASITGTGVMKGPIPEKKKHMAFIEGELIQTEEVQPVSTRVHVSNCFPDPSCGMNIQNGAYHWERDDLSERALNDLKDQGYIAEQIEKCIQEGPFKATKTWDDQSVDRGDQLGLSRREKSKLFEIWYYYGRLKKEDLEAAGLDVESEDKITNVDIHIVMVNNRVIRSSPNHLDGGDFPYDYMVWQSRSGMPYGIGISRQIRIPQRIINGAGRNLMDNAGMAGGPMWVVNQGMVEPIDGIYEIAPRKGWFVGEDAAGPDDIKKAFAFITIDMMQGDLQAIIRMGMEFAEHISGLPSLLQGQQQQREETLGGQQMRRNDGSTVLRRIARQYDDNITTPHLRRYYEWILLYGEDNEKGDFVIEARGSSALLERDLQNESIVGLGQFVLNPIYGKDPKKWMNQYLMSQKLDPKNFDYDDEEWKEIVENMSKPPPDSSVQMAQMKIEWEQYKLERTQEFDTTQKISDQNYEMVMKAIDKEIQSMSEDSKWASGKDINLDKIKAHMAEFVMGLKAQMQLSADGKGPQVSTPAIEPEGRAPNDQAFQK